MEISSIIEPVRKEPNAITNHTFHSSHGCYEMWVAVKDGRRLFQKSLRKDLRGRREWEELLRKEYMLGMKLQHPCLINFYAFVETDYCGKCIEMEYFDGITLSDWLSAYASKASAKKRRNLVTMLAEGINYLHRQGVVHRDLKPDNIMVSCEGNSLKIIDFGNGDSAEMLINKRVFGVDKYGAPELAEGGTGSYKSDVWSFGVIAAEILGGQKKIFKRCVAIDSEARPSMQSVLKNLSRRNGNYLLTAIAAVVIASITAMVALNYRPTKSQPVESEISLLSTNTEVQQIPSGEKTLVDNPENPPRDLANPAEKADSQRELFIDSLTSDAISRSQLIINQIGPLMMPEDPFDDIDAANAYIVAKNHRINSIEAISSQLQRDLAGHGYGAIEIEASLSALQRAVDTFIAKIDK